MTIGISSAWDKNNFHTIIGNYSDLDKLDRVYQRSVNINKNKSTFILKKEEFEGQYYKDAQNSWSNAWYSEYKAVLAMKADALQKKLTCAYNSVLDKAVYAKMVADADKAVLDQGIISGNSPIGSGTSGIQPPSSQRNFEQLLRSGLVNRYQEELYHELSNAGGSDGDPYDGVEVGPPVKLFNPVRYGVHTKKGQMVTVSDYDYTSGTYVINGSTFSGGALPAGWSWVHYGSLGHVAHTPDVIEWFDNPNYLPWAPSDGSGVNVIGYYEAQAGRNITTYSLPSSYTSAQQHNLAIWSDKNPYWVYRQMQIEAIIEAALDASGAYYASGQDYTNEDLANLIIQSVVEGWQYVPEKPSLGTASALKKQYIEGILFDVGVNVTDPMNYRTGSNSTSLDFRIANALSGSVNLGDGDANIDRPSFHGEASTAAVNVSGAQGYYRLGKRPDKNANGEGGVELSIRDGIFNFKDIDEDAYSYTYCLVANALARRPQMPTMGNVEFASGLNALVSGHLLQFGLGDYVTPDNLSQIVDTITQAMSSSGLNLLAGSGTFIGRQWDGSIIPDPQWRASIMSNAIQTLPSAGVPVTLGSQTFVFPSVQGSLVGFVTPVISTGANPSGSGIFTTPGLVSASAIAINEQHILPNLNFVSVHGSVPINVIGAQFYINVLNYTAIDFFAWMMEGFLEAMKKACMRAMEVHSYATSSGIAIDSYASRGEYHFYYEGSEKLKEVFKKLFPDPIGSSVSSVWDGIVNGWLSGDLDDVNGVNIKDRIFKLSHGAQAPETRETDTGGFFSTVNFLKQFHMQEIKYDYWAHTVQREELVNTDLLRSIVTAGEATFKKIVSMFARALPTPFDTVLGTLLQILLPLLGVNPFPKYLFAKNINKTGPILMFGINSKFEGYGFYFLEPEDGVEEEIFEGVTYKDPREKQAKARKDKLLDEIPGCIMDGFSATRRFLPDRIGIVGKVDPNQGDINEVIVTNMSKTITDTWDGVGNSAPAKETQQRFIGSTSRIYERKYSAAIPVNHETFRTNWLTGNYQVYDRKNTYKLEFTTKTGVSVSLQKADSLNPTFGGGMLLATVDKNKRDNILLNKSLPLNGSDENIQYLGGTPNAPNELIKTLYEHVHLRSDLKNAKLVREYRDIFNMGIKKHIFITGSSYAMSGGGISSNIEIRFSPNKGKTLDSVDYLSYDPDYYKKYNRFFKNADKGQFDILLNSYYAYKRFN